MIRAVFAEFQALETLLAGLTITRRRRACAGSRRPVTRAFRFSRLHRIADLQGRRLLLKLAVPEDYEQRQWYSRASP
jgi:hypothetical protein